MKRYYTIASLPPLPHQGDAPTLLPLQLLERVSTDEQAATLIAAVYERVSLQWETPADEKRWMSYWQTLEALGHSTGCRFLVELAVFESTLASALADARVQRNPSALNLSAVTLLSPKKMEVHINAIVRKWRHIENARSAYRWLLDARRVWMEQNGGWYSFELNELVSYGAALCVAVETAVLEQRLPLSELKFGSRVPHMVLEGDV